MNWHGKKILVLGLGDTGLSVVRWGERMGVRIRVADSRSDPPGLPELRSRHPGVDVRLGAFAGDVFDDAELAVASPGVAVAGPACDPAIACARAAGKEIIGDVELFARYLNALDQGRRPQVIGITGSNGKSTVTAMAGAMCRTAGANTVVAGNIGLPVLDALAESEKSGTPDVYVLELSSFQLETTSNLHLAAAAMLNLSQDHLDRYDSMAAYAEAKKRIFLQTATQVLNRDDAASMTMRVRSKRVVTFGTDEPAGANQFGLSGSHLCEGALPLMRLADVPVAGLHNASNALAAFALTRALNLPAAALADGLRHFEGLPHRFQKVGEIRGISFYDDSKGTNVGSTVAALNGMTCPVVLIAGGEGKGQDFTPLAGPVRRHSRAVVLIGRDADAIGNALGSSGVPMLRAASMADAVAMALDAADPGDAVLLSPACASFDMFQNYKHRGDVFAQCVRNLATKERG